MITQSGRLVGFVAAGKSVTRHGTPLRSKIYLTLRFIDPACCPSSAHRPMKAYIWLRFNLTPTLCFIAVIYLLSFIREGIARIIEVMQQRQIRPHKFAMDGCHSRCETKRRRPKSKSLAYSDAKRCQWQGISHLARSRRLLGTISSGSWISWRKAVRKNMSEL